MFLGSLACIVGASILVGHALLELNGMDHRSSHYDRLAYLVLAVGGFGLFVSPFYRRFDIAYEIAAIAIGLALLILAPPRRLKPPPAAARSHRKGGRSPLHRS